ncbi:hypothetical protein GSI_02341 [Ganoderma sinense ZZ0214-1]|uniref:MYND-type domain-containing protein n=1 Tax=Ganoderma sinense ZZ0214-1 TaxID=1077348 RepID=A0A2G8SPG9_9APHY|nr:hypothetical protein GSI_02341 [Ganoderma sinense ZZ0214-1]
MPPRSPDDSESIQIARDFMSDYDSNLLAISAVAAREEIQINDDKRVTSRTCTYCKQESQVNLQSCPRCKAARYCNEECQRTDYKDNHRRECTEFVHPPRTRAFRTHLIGDETWPHSPIFAHAHEDGIGCWISTGNKVDCEMGQLSRRLIPDIKQSDPRYAARVERMLNEPKKLIPAAKQNLTTLHVLVQNRRKDNVPVLLFGGLAQVVTKASGTKDALRGRMPDDDITTFTRNGKKHVAIGVARDPWDNELRVHVAHVNGDAVDLPPYPSVVEDASQAIVALSRGDYAVMSLQFRTGDGKNINRDWQAFRLLDHVVIPFMVWNSNLPAAALAAILPSAYKLSATSTPPSLESDVKRLRLAFDQGAITRFYKDAIARGDSEFLRTHHGDIHAAMNISMNKATMVLTEHTLWLAELPEFQRPAGWRASMKNSIKLAAVGVPDDPVYLRPRLYVSHINGQALHKPPHPPGMLDVEDGIVALDPGDFAIIRIQFRVGDEYTVNMEWQALRCLDHIIIPFMPWDRLSHPISLSLAVPPAYMLPELTAWAARAPIVKHLLVPFDQDAITVHYRDYIEHGEEAFFRSHYGKAHMDLTCTAAKSSAALAAMDLLNGGFTPEEIESSKQLGEFLAKFFRGAF